MNPYESLPQSAFWKPAVAERGMLEIGGLWQPKFAISSQTRIATYGSCFAQHIGKALKSRGYSWNVTETAPAGMNDNSASAFNYGIFSSRTANIYTTTLLLQWLSWATGKLAPPSETWERDGRFLDPFRPRIEPTGFRDPGELQASRNHAIACFRASIESSDILVFTLGLTESWRNKGGGFEYPMCPGTVGGEFREAEHGFCNLGFQEVVDSLQASFEAMKTLNPRLRFILTVSPVPLTATNSGQHVLVATMHSKSILRAVAAHFHESRDDVDYFPSYEIINSPAFRGTFFESNLRSVSRTGVAFVMDSFFDCLAGSADVMPPPSSPQGSQEQAMPATGSAEDEHCEEAFLEAFSTPAR